METQCLGIGRLINKQAMSNDDTAGKFKNNTDALGDHINAKVNRTNQACGRGFYWYHTRQPCRGILADIKGDHVWSGDMLFEGRETNSCELEAKV